MKRCNSLRSLPTVIMLLLLIESAMILVKFVVVVFQFVLEAGPVIGGIVLLCYIAKMVGKHA